MKHSASTHRGQEKVRLNRMVGLNHLMRRSRGHPQISLGVIDGPVDLSHPDLVGARIEALATPAACRAADSFACRHGTYVLGILAASRASAAPAICPGCRFLLRPIFGEAAGPEGVPQAKPEELAQAIVELASAGVRLINLSLGLDSSGNRSQRLALQEAYDFAFDRGVLLLVASGNQGRVGFTPLLNHHWPIPVTACDVSGRPLAQANIGHSIGRRGLMAPGAGVPSLSSGGGYAYMQGTSTAAPFVTGALALLWSLHPRASAAHLRQALLPSPANRSLIPPLLNAGAAWMKLAERAAGTVDP